MKNNKPLINDEEFERQIREAEKREKEFPRNEIKAVAVRFDSEQERFIIDFVNKTSFVFPASLLPELNGATREQLADVRLWGEGYTIGWTKLDQHFGVKNLIQDLLRAIDN